jgi:hypothetical protein
VAISRIWVTAIGIIALTGVSVANPSRVQIWTEEPNAEVDQWLQNRGIAIVPFDARKQALHDLWTQEVARANQILSGFEDELKKAEDAYMAQELDHMLELLLGLEAQLGRIDLERNRALIWRLELLIGLGYATRGQEGDGERAQDRFVLCLHLDPDRELPVDRYGPALEQMFASARATMAQQVDRPLSLETRPSHARVTLDGRPLGSHTSPGLHLLSGQALGHLGNTQLIDTRRESTIAFALDRGNLAIRQDVARLWFSGQLDATQRSHREALLELAGASGADSVLVVSAKESGYQLRLIQGHAELTSASSKVIAQALEQLFGKAVVEPEPLAPVPVASKAWYSHWWVWTGAGAVATVTAGALVYGLSGGGSGRLQVKAPSESP